MKSYKRLNLILFIINLILLIGIFWVFVKYTDYTEVIEYTESTEVREEGIPTQGRDRQEVIEHTENTEVGEEDTEVIDNTEVIENTESTEVIEELPNKINLSVPFTSQAPEKDWEQPWQDACEEAGVLMLDAYYKGYGLSPLFSKDEILKMVAWEDERGWKTSISVEKVSELGEWFLQIQKHENTKTQKHLRIVENPTVEEIKGFVAGGDPVLVLAYGKDLPNPHFRNDGPEYHALIIRGYDEDEFITNDPGTQFGENFKYKYEDLMNAIHDWNDGRVEEGRKVVIVID